MSERDPFNVEMDLLRNFFDKWAALHQIPTNETNMQQKRQAAQDLVGAAWAVRHFRSPVSLAS